MKFRTIVATVVTTICASVAVASPVDNNFHNESDGIVNIRTYPQHSHHVLSNNQVTGHVLDILSSRCCWDAEFSDALLPNAVYIGGKGEISGTHSNFSDIEPSIYPAHVPVPDDSSTIISMPYADFSVTSTVGDWVTAYTDFQVNDITSSNVILPKAYFVVGNLEKLPMYFFGGKKVVEFGSFDSVTNFTPTLTRAYFMAYGSQIGAGLSIDGFNFVATLMNGSYGGILNSKSSSSLNSLDNFAINTIFNYDLGEIDLSAGLGYIQATGFSKNSTFENSTAEEVGAISVNASARGYNFEAVGEFLITLQDVKGVNSSSVYSSYNLGNQSFASLHNDASGFNSFGFNSLPTLVKFDSGQSVKGWSLGLSHSLELTEYRDIVPYASYSQVMQDLDNNLYQVEMGIRCNVVDVDTIWVGGSYNYVSGKSYGVDIGEFRTLSLDATMYF